LINAHALTTSAGKRSISSLVAAIDQSPAQDAFNCRLSALQWETLADYLQAQDLPEGRVLIERGAPDRTVYFVESGSLSVHYQDNLGRVRMAIVSAGSVVGEGGFFSHIPRSATVQASGPAKLWLLSPLRFLELANRHSPIALELSLGLGRVMARRLNNRAKRVAVC
jgi:CRP/FNR family transcriptional regulator, cyclic AMP receptor protein